MKIEVQKRRQYSAEFKRQAVEMLIYGERDAKSVCRELGIPMPNLMRWRSKFLNEGAEGKSENKLSPAAMEQQIRQLKRQLRDTEMERDILKKAVSIFSQRKEGE